MEFALTTLQQMFFIRCYYCFFCARVHESYNGICQHAVTPASNTLMLIPLTRACKRDGNSLPSRLFPPFLPLVLLLSSLYRNPRDYAD